MNIDIDYKYEVGDTVFYNINGEQIKSTILARAAGVQINEDGVKIDNKYKTQHNPWGVDEGVLFTTLKDLNESGA